MRMRSSSIARCIDSARRGSRFGMVAYLPHLRAPASPTIMRLSPLFLRALALASLWSSAVVAQEPTAAPTAGPMRTPPITLGPDDVRAVPDAPAGFNAKRDGIPHGTLEMIEYDSKTVGTRRKMLVY